MSSKVRSHGRRRTPEKVKMKFDVPPEMLREQGIETDESMPVTMEVTVPKDAKREEK